MKLNRTSDRAQICRVSRQKGWLGGVSSGHGFRPPRPFFKLAAVPICESDDSRRGVEARAHGEVWHLGSRG